MIIFVYLVEIGKKGSFKWFYEIYTSDFLYVDLK